MAKRTGSMQSKIVDMIGLLVRAPRTITELSELTGMDRSALYPWLHLMVEERLVRREDVGRGTPHSRYFWSPPNA